MDNCISMLLFFITISQFDPSHSSFVSAAKKALHLTTELKKWNKKEVFGTLFRRKKRLLARTGGLQFKGPWSEISHLF